MCVCVFLSVFDEHNSFANQQHLGHDFLSVFLKDTFKVTSEIDFPTSSNNSNTRNLIQEMNNMNLDILGIAETRWKDSGKITKDKYTLIYSGGEDHSNGVGVMVKNTIAKSIIGYWAISDRVLLVIIKRKTI